jgi:hypothetical protein
LAAALEVVIGAMAALLAAALFMGVEEAGAVALLMLAKQYGPVAAAVELRHIPPAPGAR